VVGCPNVGKSSLLNSISRSRVAKVSSTAGSTRSLQSIQFDKHISFLDSPGVVFPSSSTSILAIPAQEWDDPTTPLEPLFDPVLFCSHYSTQFCDSLVDFFQVLGRKYGIIKRGGVVNVNEVAKRVIGDIQKGTFPLPIKPQQQNEDFTLNNTNGEENEMNEEEES